MGTDCKSVGERLRWFESSTPHHCFGVVSSTPPGPKPHPRRPDFIGTPPPSGGEDYAWDPLGYLYSITYSTGTQSSMYDASGLRIWRLWDTPSTDYVTVSNYDGQMPIAEKQFANGSTSWERQNALGARGIDGMKNSGSWVYPLYDVHGNVKATLARSGSTFSTANWKSFDAWGGERASTGSGSMYGYCGNLGHPTDPETGLIYMRARYYEPWTGRFISEDPIGEGSNWYIYANNSPSQCADWTGYYVDFPWSNSIRRAMWWTAKLATFAAFVYSGCAGGMATKLLFAIECAFLVSWFLPNVTNGSEIGTSNIRLGMLCLIVGFSGGMAGLIAHDGSLIDESPWAMRDIATFWINYVAFLALFIECEFGL